MAKRYMVSGFSKKKKDKTNRYPEFQNYYKDEESLVAGMKEYKKTHEVMRSMLPEIWEMNSYPLNQFSFYDTGDIVGRYERGKFVKHDCTWGKRGMKGLRVGPYTVLPIETSGVTKVGGLDEFKKMKKCKDGCSIMKKKKR